VYSKTYRLSFILIHSDFINSTLQRQGRGFFFSPPCPDRLLVPPSLLGTYSSDIDHCLIDVHIRRFGGCLCSSLRSRKGYEPQKLHVYEGVSKIFRTESLKKLMLTFDIIRREATQRVMAKKLIRLTHKIATQLHLVAENCTICSSRSRRPVRELLDTPPYMHVTHNFQHPIHKNSPSDPIINHLKPVYPFTHNFSNKRFNFILQYVSKLSRDISVVQR
jgi:hypothetical protein